MPSYQVLVAVPRPLRDDIVSEQAMQKLHSFAQVTLNEDGRNWSSAELAQELPGQDALIGSWGLAKLTPDVLEKAERLRIVAYAAGSVKRFISDELFERGIALTHSACRLADSVAEFSLLMAMMGLRRPHELDRRLKAGDPWPKGRDQAPMYEIAGKKVGLLGMGNAGRRTARLFLALGAEVWAYDPYLSTERATELGVRKAELDDLLAACHVVSVHLPVTEETHHLLGARELALMRDGAVLVNTARSWVIDQEALIRELASRRLWAALDVFDTEPLPVDDRIRKLDSVLLTPHVAALTRDTHRALMGRMIDEVERFRLGQPLEYQITPDMLVTMA